MIKKDETMKKNCVNPISWDNITNYENKKICKPIKI